MPISWATIPAAYTFSGIVEEGTYSTDGAWSWYSDPRAFVDSGVLYVGYVRRNGDACYSSQDLTTGVWREVVLHASLEADDHNDPVAVVRPDGRHIAFYSTHGSDAFMRYRVMTNPHDITAWDAEQTLSPPSGGRVTYSNPILIPATGRIYLFLRAELVPLVDPEDSPPHVTYSDDFGATWATIRSLFQPVAGNRPYVKYASDGSRIHFWATTGHPQNITQGQNDLYHWTLDTTDGFFYKSDGTQSRSFASLSSGPLVASDVTLVRDASAADGHNGWVHSIELDSSGRPVCTFIVYKGQNAIDGAKNDYGYCRWNGTTWLFGAGLPVDQGSLYGPGVTVSPAYTAGIFVDPDDTRVVLLGRQLAVDDWQIERWMTFDGGLTWPSQVVLS